MKHLPKSFWMAAAWAVGIKIFLFVFIAVTNPQSVMEFDSYGYLSCASTLSDWFLGKGGMQGYDIFRTPGYPFFLMIVYNWMKVPLLGIVAIHLMMNVLAAWITAKAAERIDPRLVPMSALVILFDVPTTIFSLLLMTEALFLIQMSVLLWAGIRYLQEFKWRWLLIACVTLTAAVFTRPAAYYLPLMLGGLLFTHTCFFRKDILVRLLQMIVFLAIAYGLIFSWQYRNAKVPGGRFAFSSIDNATIKMHGLIGRYARGDTANKVDAENMNPVVYYVYTTSRHVIDLMTEPGSLKYFGSDIMKKIGKVFGYLEVFLWLPAFLVALFRVKKDVYFWFAAMTVLYFMAVTIVAVGWETTPRFRVPMMPFIAVLAAQGWLLIMEFFRNRNHGKQGEKT